VIARVSSLDAVKPSAMSHLEEVLREQFLNKSGTSSATFGGVKTAAQILKYSGSEVESSILKSVNELDKTLAEKLEENMFTFMNLGGLDNKSMQTLIRDLENDLLIPALKGADEAVKDKFLENMSERARDLFLDDLEAQGPIRITEVEKSQKEIMRVARKLSEEGEIMLSSGGNEFV
jgi:flagellar motor switch protein FliG